MEHSLLTKLRTLTGASGGPVLLADVDAGSMPDLVKLLRR
jgi:hypothetical protein